MGARPGPDGTLHRPGLEDELIIIDNDNDDALAGQFSGLAEGALFAETCLGRQYALQVSYFRYVGNDVVLTVADWATIPASGATVPAGLGVGLVGWLRRRRRL